MATNTHKKVIVSGCFDLLHSGHIAFLQSAAAYGNLYVCLGSDQTIFELKKRNTINPEQERKYILESLQMVHEVCISTGSGYLDFLPELLRIQPDYFVVNEDGYCDDKKALCEANNIELIVLPRVPYSGLPARSTTDLRKINTIPYRIDLAGGWLDQPFVSIHAPGSVITISIEPSIEFNTRSGMASSTRKFACEIWQNHLPSGNEEHNAKLLFAFENPPGKTEIAGSQDAIGIVYPGLNKSNYHGAYWPHSINSVHDERVLSFIEKHLFLIPLGPRNESYDVLANTNISRMGVQALAAATEDCWNALLFKDLQAFGKAMTDSFEAQIAMFPNMVDTDILDTIQKYKHLASGYKISGAGGGGYLIVAAEKPIENALQITIRRK